MSRFFRCAVVLACIAWSTSLVCRASTYLFPQLAVGSSGNLRVQTLVTVSNPTTNPTNATVVIATMDDVGLAWTLTWEARGRPDLAVTDSWMTFALLPGSSVTLMPAFSGPIKTGWLKAISSQPVVMTLRYSVALVTAAGTDPQWEVGVLPAGASNEHFVFVGEGAADWYNSTTGTALAMCNMAPESATITLELFDSNGLAPIKTKIETLPGSGHSARFVAEIFNDVNFSPAFRGMLRISANTALAVVSLQKWQAGSDSVYASAGTLPYYASRTSFCLEDESMDSPGGGRVIPLPGEMVGTLSSASDGADTDNFRVYLKSGETLSVLALGEILGSSLSPQIQFLDSNQTLLGTGAAFLPGFGESALQITVQQTGFYILRVTSPSSSHGRQHFYRLFLARK